MQKKDEDEASGGQGTDFGVCTSGDHSLEAAGRFVVAWAHQI